MYDDLALSSVQRAQIDSVLDQRNCQMRALMDPLKPQADSIRAAGQEQMLRILTPEQRARFEQRRAEIDARRKAERQARGPKRPTETCN
jgi:Spy/CpxP family protein refolding chaperone